MTHSTTAAGQLPSELLWLADAPLFIDRRQVEAFYDAVVRPAFKTGKVVDTTGADVKVQVAGKATTEVKLSFSSFWQQLATIFPSLEGKLGGELSGGRERVSREQVNIELVPIDTPERQLLLLTLHYIQLHQKGLDRFFIVQDPSNESWRTTAFIKSVPRGLIYLELPGQADAVSPLVPTMLIPTAAEFDGAGEEAGVVELFTKMPGYDPQKPYPERASTPAELRELRRLYWHEFQKGFSATKAMIAVETAAKKARGRVRWIDYRLPITDQGDTLHLHVVPAGDVDTGVFAYNLIKRGLKHGLRIVGTLKSEPDMNVLAIYER
jgi:hypothetical protein